MIEMVWRARENNESERNKVSEKVKWTPGPWTWGNDGENSLPIVTAHSRPGYVAFVRDPGGVEGSEIEANARLIASAPELAEVLRAAVACFTEFDTDEKVSGADLVDWFSGWRTKAKAVLAKVEGSEP